MNIADFPAAARREVARVLALARKGIDRELKPQRVGVTYGDVTVNTRERYKARCQAYKRNPHGWRSK
jgi:hypothetical protein